MGMQYRYCWWPCSGSSALLSILASNGDMKTINLKADLHMSEWKFHIMTKNSSRQGLGRRTAVRPMFAMSTWPREASDKPTTVLVTYMEQSCVGEKQDRSENKVDARRRIRKRV